LNVPGRNSMDCLINNEILINWLTQYGAISLFVLLVFGIIALPIPEETLMVLAGVLIKKGGLLLFPTLIAGYLGSISGISLSYLLGLLFGKYLLDKFEKKDFLKKNLMRVHKWFDRFGKWTLLIGYFIPGVRHFSGFTAGVMKMEYKKFALFAYTGAIFWVSTFISIGYFFGNYCFSFLEELDVDMNLIFITIGSIIVLYFLFYKLKPLFVKLWRKIFH